MGVYIHALCMGIEQIVEKSSFGSSAKSKILCKVWRMALGLLFSLSEFGFAFLETNLRVVHGRRARGFAWLVGLLLLLIILLFFDCLLACLLAFRKSTFGPRKKADFICLVIE